MSIEDVRSAFDDMMAGSATEAEVSEAIDKLAEPCVYRPRRHGLMPTCADVQLCLEQVDPWTFCPYCGGKIEVWKAVPRAEEG